jgi:hypothetical protein
MKDIFFPIANVTFMKKITPLYLIHNIHQNMDLN